MGIFSLAGTLVLEAWKTSLGTAVAMGCLVFFGVVLCLGFAVHKGVVLSRFTFP